MEEPDGTRLNGCRMRCGCGRIAWTWERLCGEWRCPECIDDE